jgi:hypothetical protein
MTTKAEERELGGRLFIVDRAGTTLMEKVVTG